MSQGDAYLVPEYSAHGARRAGNPESEAEGTGGPRASPSRPPPGSGARTGPGERPRAPEGPWVQHGMLNLKSARYQNWYPAAAVSSGALQLAMEGSQVLSTQNHSLLELTNACESVFLGSALHFPQAVAQQRTQ